MNEEILIKKLLSNIELRKQEVYKFNAESKLSPTEVKMENAYKAGYIKALEDLSIVLLQLQATL